MECYHYDQIRPYLSSATKQKLTEKRATDIINLIFNEFTEALKNGDRIEIRYFGSYSIREYNSYEGRNPKTGEKTAVQSKKLPFFKVGKELKEMVDSKIFLSKAIRFIENQYLITAY